MNDSTYDFENIKKYRKRIRQHFVNMQKVRNTIAGNYAIYLKKEDTDYFGLDSFHFQNKIIDIELSDLTKLYRFIDNRIYGDYYKLFSEIKSFLKSTLKTGQCDKIKEFNTFNEYPVYRDLEYLKSYDFDLINNIHRDILMVINAVREIHKDNERGLRDHTKMMNSGLNIDNYVINLQFKNTILKTMMTKYETYLQVYHKYHINLLSKFNEKISLCFQHIDHADNDERFNRSSSVSSFNSTDTRDAVDSPTNTIEPYMDNKGCENLIHKQSDNDHISTYGTQAHLDTKDYIIIDTTNSTMNDENMNDSIIHNESNLIDYKQSDTMNDFQLVQSSKKKKRKRNKNKNNKNNHNDNDRNNYF
jgi:hypothetical protein